MGGVDAKVEILESILRSKEERRARLSRLSFPEKVRIVVQLQRMQAPILAARGRKARIWEIEE